MTCSSHDPNVKFALKHPENATPNVTVERLLAMRPKVYKKEISCALAHQIAKSAKVSPAEVGFSLDLLEYRINLCQLGLFGHKPVSKIMAPAKPTTEIANVIKAAMEADGSLSCAKIWELAKTFKLPKMVTASYCAFLKIKIKPCQLGAF